MTITSEAAAAAAAAATAGAPAAGRTALEAVAGRLSGGGTVEGTGIGSTFAASCLSVARDLMGNFVLDSQQGTPSLGGVRYTHLHIWHTGLASQKTGM
jgi:hypothetical protein